MDLVTIATCAGTLMTAAQTLSMLFQNKKI
jgi:hypothetical protein